MRRRFLAGMAASLAVTWMSPMALAQASTYPEKPVRILVGFPPGQATDIVARLLAERLSGALGQPVLVENKPGQGGSMALAALAKSPADGHTLMLSATASLVVNPHLYKSVGYDTLKDFAPIATVADLPLLLVAHPSKPFGSFQELVAHAKANPRKLTYASSGNGTLSHLGMEMLKSIAGVELVHVPYQGSARSMTDLVAGNVDVALDTVAVTLPHIEAKRMKLLAAASEQRIPLVPDVPTLGELGHPGFTVSPWLGLLAPRSTPPAVVTRVSEEVRKVIADPEIAQKFRALGAVPRPGTVPQFTRLLAREYESWGRAVRESGARVD